MPAPFCLGGGTMRKVFFTGVGSLVLSGLLVMQSWAGSYKADVVCPTSIPPPPVIIKAKKGAVTVSRKGDVKGSITLFEPLTGPLSLDCVILCEGSPATGPAPCVDVKAGAKKIKINAPGLGA